MTGIDSAQVQAGPPGSPNWYALLYTPAPRRQLVADLFELRAQILDSARVPSEPAVAQARLQWWRAELANFGSGREQHPLTRRLRDAGCPEVLQAEYLQEIVDAAESELSDPACRNYAELALYCYRSSGVLHEMIAGALGPADPANERPLRRYAQRLGTGVRLVETLAQFGGERTFGRRLLPRDWLEETGATQDPAATPRDDPALLACLDRLAGEARLALDEAETLLPAGERSRQRTGLVLAALCRRHLSRLHANGFDPRSLPGNLDNLWTAWRAARKAHRDRP